MKKLTFKPYVLGVIGPISSGKDCVANYFVKKYGFKKITLSNFLRQEARKRNRQPGREYLRKLQAELREKYGWDYLVSRAIDFILAKDHLRMKNVVIDGLRTPEEAKLAKQKLKLKIILVDADPFIRYKRAKARHRKGFAKTFEQFLHEEAIENAVFNFHKTKKLANYKIMNNGTIKEMNQEINKLMKKLRKKK